MRRVGNNWRITLRMRYKKKARGEVLEHMVLHGIANLVGHWKQLKLTEKLKLKN